MLINVKFRKQVFLHYTASFLNLSIDVLKISFYSKMHRITANLWEVTEDTMH